MKVMNHPKPVLCAVSAVISLWRSELTVSGIKMRGLKGQFDEGS
jgi:hypothetical protein